jgi:catechol 2,3-dioxygenase-like lactoylglutathione lyase family enzyme
MNSRVERINPYRNVQDLADSIQYYTKILGFELVVETPELGIIQRDGHQIHLILRTTPKDPQQVWSGVDDITPLYHQFLQHDAQILEPPTNFPWAYQMVISDLDDNRLIFGSGPLEAA